MKQKVVTAIGLDVGTYSVKCVEMAHSKDAIELHRVTILPLPNTAKLQDILKAMDLQGAKHVRISVSGPSVLVRRITLPLMTPAELKGAIRFEAESHIPFPIDDCILDSQILNQPDKKTMNVMLVAAKKDFIQSRLKALAELDIHPDLIDIDIFCLLNVFEILKEKIEDKSYGVLNIGHNSSSFAIVQSGLPFFVREIPFGGAKVTKALAEIKGLTEEEADKWKMERAPERLNDLEAATQKGFEPLIDEIQHSIDYFENEAAEELKTVWISGGGALSHEAAVALSVELDKKVSFWDNTKKLQIFGNIDEKFLAQHSGEFNVAFGLALRGFEKAK